MSSADAVSLCLNGIDGQINALDQNARHLATSNDVEAAREQAREAARVAVRSKLPSLRTALERELASMATAAPTADTIAALIATAVSDGVADMQQRLPGQAVPRHIVQTGRTYADALRHHAHWMRSWTELNPEYEYSFFGD